MKLTTTILISALLQVSAAGMAQHLTLNKKNVSLAQVFKEIRKQTGYSILWESEKFDANGKVSVEFKNSSLKEVLNFIINSDKYSYLIDEKTIVIQPKDKYELNDQIVVSGKVVDENGSPLSGASVVLKANGKGTSTTVDGTFTMSGVDDGAILVIKYIGFDPKEVKAARELGTIKLNLATSELDAVQIQAYTTTSKRLSLSNSVSVRAKEIEDQIVSNPLLALQGKVAGIQIQQVSGNAGATINVKIQGVSSFRGNSSPFFVVDGVPYSSTTMVGTGNINLWGEATPTALGVAGNNAGISYGSGNPLSFLNPDDIESIDVLKDADATAIYGSRAANGAIVITTKRGKPGTLQIDFSSRNGWNQATFGADFLNTEQYLGIRNEAYRNSNAVISATNYDLNGIWDKEKFTDWQKELIKTTGYDDASLSVSGGTLNSSYRLNLTGNRQNSAYARNFRNDNIALSISLNTASANQKFKLGIVGNYLNGFNNLPSLNQTTAGSFLYLLPPNAPNLYNTDGTLNWDMDPTGTISRFRNPLSTYLTNPFEVKTNNFTSNITASYNIVNGLDFKTSFGYNRLDQQEFTSNLAESVAPTARNTFIRSGSYRFTNTNNYIIEPQILYNHQFSGHKLNFLLGATYNKSQGETSGITGSGQSSDSQVKNLSASSSFNQTGSSFYEYRYNAGFFRLDYNFKERYLLGLSARRDGSTRFGPDNRFANFWSAAVGWIVSEETLVKEKLPWLNFFKLRANYGLTGSDGVGDYTFMDLYSANTFYLPYQNVVGFAPGRLLNSKLQWEEKRSLNIGFDANLLNNRVTLGINYNRNRSSNLLQSLNLPVTAGFASVDVNFDALVQNTGWEYTIGVKLLAAKAFKWNVNANLTVPTNKLLSLPSLDKVNRVAGFGYHIGLPLGTTTMNTYMGVNPLTGLEVLEDINGNPVATAGSTANMKTTLRNLYTSPFYAGLQSSFEYKGLSMNLSFDFNKQLKPRYFFVSSRPGRDAYNQPEIAYSLNRWENPGDIAVIQKYSTLLGSGLLTQTEAFYEDATYLRLTNIAISWNLPKSWTGIIGMKSSRIGINAQNLFTLSKYSGPDPITGPSGVMPPMRVIVLNVRASF